VFVIENKPFAAKHARQSAISKRSPLYCNVFEPLDKIRIVNTRWGVLRKQFGPTSYAARCALTQSAVFQGPHRFFSLRGLQKFFRASFLRVTSKLCLTLVDSRLRSRAIERACLHPYLRTSLSTRQPCSDECRVCIRVRQTSSRLFSEYRDDRPQYQGCIADSIAK
jgi:hypothetical protein